MKNLKTGLLFCSLFLSGLTFSGCSEKNERAGIDPQKNVKAATDMELSFDKAAASDLSVDKAHVVIKKSALAKEFLLSVNLLSQTPTPMFSSLQSRVVSFVLRDGKVYLLDVTKNNNVGNNQNISQALLIAEFNVLSETEKNLEIDFNSGMSQIFVGGDMFGSDDPGFNGADFKLNKLDVRLSYLDEVTLNQSALFIRQVAQVEGADSATAVEVRYQIKPYNPDPGFVPRQSPGFDKVGFFEANPLLLFDGSSRVYAMKWNEKKSIQFAISANTPMKYRKLIRSALLYWNKILGENAVEVVQLQDSSLTAPHFDLNIIQWADWDAAGYAFADAHVDPRSGEVTSAQIFLPSAFFIANVPKRLRLLGTARKKISLYGFKSARLCNRDVLKDLAGREQSEEATPRAMEKAVFDYVYETVAHELGHVLGLRHNFAGSLAANYDYKDRKKLILSYYKNEKAPEGIVASNSVMDYSRFEESSWNGDLLQNGAKALAYDEMAINFLYKNSSLPKVRPFFCTDSDIQTYADCNMSDAGRSIVSGASGAHLFNFDSLAAILVNVYIKQSKEAEEKAQILIPVADVDLNAAKMAESLSIDLAKLVSLLSDKTKLIAIRSQFQPVISTMLPQIETAEKNYLAAEIHRLGGLENLLSIRPENFESELSTNFGALLEIPKYNSGTRADGSRYSFSISEKETMKTQVGLFAKQMHEELVLNEIKILSGVAYSFEETYGQTPKEANISWADSESSAEFSPVVLKKFAEYALDRSGKKLMSEIILKDGTKKTVELPLYRYSQQIRNSAVNLLLSHHQAVDFNFFEKQKAIGLVEKEISLLGEVDKLDMSSLDRNVLKWYLNNKKIQSALSE